MEQPIQFEGTGLDLDSNLASMNPGDSPLCINCRKGSTQDSNRGGVQNFPGNTAIDKQYGGGIFVPPNGNNVTIGSCRDVQRNAIIYFVWNSLGFHQIRRYFTEDNSIQLILQSPLLNFQRANKIVHADVIGETLCWTDGWVNPNDPYDYNAPRSINIDKAVGYTLGNPWPNGYATIDAQVIDFIKYAPPLCPTFTYINDTNFQDNRLYGKLFQFGYRWVYFDNSVSVVSPLSKLTQPQGEDVEGNYVMMEENRLDVTVKTGHFTVVRIELVALSNGVYTVVDWADKYDSAGGVIIPSNADYLFRFFNNKYVKTLTSDEALRNEDYIPQVSSVLAFLKTQAGARCVLGQNLEGYPNVADFSMSVTIGAEKIDPNFTKYKRISFKRKGAYQLGVVYSDGAGRKSYVQTNETLRTAIPWWLDGALIQQYYNPNDEWILSTHQKIFLTWMLNSPPPVWAKYYQIVCTNDIQQQQRLFVFQSFGAGVGDDENGQWGTDTNSIYIPPQIGYDFQEGDRMRLIAQYDNFGNANVPDMEVVGFYDPNFNPKVLGSITPLNDSAVGQDKYQVALWKTYTDPTNQIWDFKIKRFDSSLQRAVLEGDGIPFTRIELKTLFIYEIYNPNTEIPAENERFFEIGETYEIIDGQHSVTTGRIDGIDIFVANRRYELKPGEYRFQVKSFDEGQTLDQVGGLYINARFSSATGLFNSHQELAPFVFATGFCASYIGKQGSRTNKQVYVNGATERPNSLEGVNTSYLLRDGVYQQSSVLAYQVTFAGGNLCAGAQDGGENTTVRIFSPCREIDLDGLVYESHSYSPFYSSDVNQNGRPYVINRESVRRTYTNLRWGGAVIDNSLVNFFSTFYAADELKLSEAYNQITRIQVAGDTLKVRQLNKSTSIYIDRTQTMNADGSSNLITADKVLGTTIASQEVWGGTNGASDQMAVRDTYFFDYLNGVVVRDSPNGLIAISGNKDSPNDPFKMSAFFRDAGNYVRQTQPDVEVFAAYDENTECYILTIKSLRRETDFPDFVKKYRLQEAWKNGLTIAFHEPWNRWETFHNFVPEWYASIGNTFLSFVDGQAYLHYSNELHNYYYETPYDTVCAVQSNQKPNTSYIRVFDNIDIYSNAPWAIKGSPNGDDIYILPTSNNPTGMVSELDISRFVAKEGVFHASFLHNMNTAGIDNRLLALVGGDQLRGEAVKLILRNSDTTPVFMREVIVHTTHSEMSG